MAVSNVTDLYNLDALLTDEERIVRDTLREWVQDQVMPKIANAFETAHFPREWIKDLADLGVFGANLEGYECAGLNSVCYGLICQELERGDSGLRSFVSVQSSLVMWPIHQYGSEEQKSYWLPKLAKGEAIGCFGLTEAQGGSDPMGMTTLAQRQGDDWIIQGSKMWITNGNLAQVALIWAKTEEGIQGFLVPTDTPGFRAQEIHQKMSLRASVTSALYFDQMRVPGSCLLPKATSIKAALSCLTQARFGISWGAIGAALACFTEALAYSKDRKLFQRALSDTQTIQRRLADMSRKITCAQLLAFQLAKLKDAGTLDPVQVSLAKWNNVRAALEIARDARDLLGGNGITLDYCAIRHMLNLESVITYEGTETVHELVIGRYLTGSNAF